MKYLRTFEEKNIGTLYHFTNLISLSDILYYDELTSYRTVSGFDELKNQRGLKDSQHDFYISFTRNKNFHKTHTKNIDAPITCRITIDGNKLSQFYKLYSVNYFASSERRSTLRERESEECIVVPHALKDLHKYILKVEVPSFEIFHQGESNSSYDETFINKFINKCEEYGIENYGSDVGINYGELQYEDIEFLYDNLINSIQYDDILEF